MKVVQGVLGTVLVSLNPTLTVLPALLAGLVLGLFVDRRLAADLAGVGGVFLFLGTLFCLVPMVLAALFAAGARGCRIRMEAKVPSRLQAFLRRATVAASALGVLLAWLVGAAFAPGWGRLALGKGPVLPQIFSFGTWGVMAILILGVFAYLTGSSASLTRADGAPLRQLGLSLCRVLQNVYSRLLPWVLPLAALGAACLVTAFATGGNARYPGPQPWMFPVAFGTVLVPLALVPSLVVPAACWYGLRRCGKDCPRHFLGFFWQVLVQAAADCSRGRVEPVLIHNLVRLGVPAEAALARTRAALLAGPVSTAFYVAFVAASLPLPLGMLVPVPLKLLLAFALALLLGRADLPVPSAALALVLFVPTFLLGTGKALPVLLLLFLFERGLDIIRTVTNVLFAGTAVYLSDKLGW